MKLAKNSNADLPKAKPPHSHETQRVEISGKILLEVYVGSSGRPAISAIQWESQNQS
ncbi:unnamed protein product [Prunus brigantina]